MLLDFSKSYNFTPTIEKTADFMSADFRFAFIPILKPRSLIGYEVFLY